MSEDRRDVFADVLAHLVAAVSLLEKTPQAKKAAPSDKMFDQMMEDYHGSIERGRTHLSRSDAAPETPDEVAALREQVEDLRSTMEAWFELAKKTEEAVTPVLMDGLRMYLRRSRNGGMPTKIADAAEAVLEDYCRLYVGKALVPVLRGLAPAPDEPAGKPVPGM